MNYPSSIPCKFLHDRVQQAAYSLIPTNQKKQAHLKVGQLLLKSINQNEIEENIFDIVNQLNIGAELIIHQVKRDELAKLNLIAGKKAKASIAYEHALRYLETSLGLLATDSWNNQYQLTLEIYVETIEAQYLNTQFDQAEKLSIVVLQQAKTVLDKVKVYELKIQSYISKLQYKIAIDAAMQVLVELGIVLPQKPSKVKKLTEQLHQELLPITEQVETLANLPEMTDLSKLAAVRILLTITSSAIITEPLLYPLMTLTAVDICIKYGNPPHAAGVFVFYGLFLCSAIKDIYSGYQFGQLSLKLLNKFSVHKALVRHFYHGFIQHGKEPIRDIVKRSQEVVHIGLETGYLEHSCYGAATCCILMFCSGYPLAEVEEQSTQYISFAIKLKQEYSSCSI